MDANTENLIGQNPRDSLILRRKGNLAMRDEAKRRVKLDKAREDYNYALKLFAPEYLAVEDKNIFDSLSKQEKDALSKIYESSCWHWLIGHVSILTAFLASFAYIGIVYAPGFLAIPTIALLLYGMYGLWELPIKDINFIKSRRMLLKHREDSF